ncbi:MAG: cyclase [Gemmatimonadetes bacterium]|nr:MAG: cyclase [Gemmatimonadota bacterium]
MLRPYLPGGSFVKRARILVALTLVGCTRSSSSLTDALSRATWVDLTYAFDSTTIYWPTAKPFRLEVVSAQRTSGGYYYAANNFAAAEHGGTHLDAPVHFAEGRHTTDQIPLTQLTGPAVVVDVSRPVAADRDYRVAPADFEAWERTHTRVPEGAIVLVRTGWGSRWPDRDRYLGTIKTGAAAVPELHFPGLHPDAARWLVARKVHAVGIDTPSIDYGQSATFDTHQILFAADIPAFENVAHLSAVPATGAFVIALPMKIRGGSGGPLRLVAVLPEGTVPE